MANGIQETAQQAKQVLSKGLQGTAWITGPIGAWIWFFIKILLGTAITVFGIISIYKFWLQYNIRVTLWRRTAGGGKTSQTERAKIDKDDQGKRKLVLWRTKDGGDHVTSPVPKSKYKVIEDQSLLDKLLNLSAVKYHLFLDDEMQLHPIQPPSLEEKDHYERSEMNVDTQQRRAWSKLEDRRIEKKHDTTEKWKDLLPYGALVFTGIMIFLMFYFGYQQLGASMANLQSTFQQVAASCTKLTSSG